MSGDGGIEVYELKKCLRDNKEQLIKDIVNKSVNERITKSLELLNDGYDWIVDIDLERFFETVNHDRLMNLVSRVVKDGDVISLIRKFLVSGIMKNNHFETTKEGTPQGSPLSPLLSNNMLNELDKNLI